MNESNYSVPIGDVLMRESECSLMFTDQLCAMFAGGPSGQVRGKIFLTNTELAFRPTQEQPHPQMVTVPRSQVTAVSVFHPKVLGFLPSGKTKLRVEWSPHQSFCLDFDVAQPESWVKALQGPAAEVAAPNMVLDDALEAGVGEVGRYTAALASKSFPAGFWHVEAPDDMFEVVEGCLEDLGLAVPPEWLRALDLQMEPSSGPEDYETGPGSEAWCRREQIARICEAINAAGFSSDHQFYQFEETIPHWDFDEPVWLWLSKSQRNRLLELGVLREYSPPD